MADVHLHDIYGTFDDIDYSGVKNPATGKYNTIRTMGAQLRSTRLFNENYFAFLAALDDAVERGVSYVVLPGDFSDDGQPLNVRAVRQILDRYSQRYNISFFAITGNHDPVRPFAMPAGKTDFLGEGGRQQVIVSQLELAQKSTNGLLPIVTADIQKMGYDGVLTELKNYGFYPKHDYLYWETPFSDYTPKTYSYEKALPLATLENRTYAISPHGTKIPDASYLVEPVEGLWLLALDGNVYIPEDETKDHPSNPKYYGSASIGYNQVMTHKGHLIPWVEKVVAMAKKQEKMLIAFSHYPMVDFNDDATIEMVKMFGENAFQLHRVPSESIALGFAEAGLQIHFGGHMHINDTGIKTTKTGNTLVNVQVPSLAAYCPAYKIATLRSSEEIEVETIRMDTVPNFQELFPLYKMEQAHLKESLAQDIWDAEILSSDTFGDFTEWHLRELVRLRFLKNDWPKGPKNLLLSLNGAELWAAAKMDSNLFVNGEILNKATLDRVLAEAMREDKTMPWDQLLSWTGFDLMVDFYKIRNGDELALDDIGRDRLQKYLLVLNAFQSAEKEGPQKKIGEFATIFKKMLKGTPSDHFRVDLEKGQVIRVDRQFELK
ncbi:metallophosphoesterase [Muricauda sp. SCSIO 65647]|nr:metallophosphoesterase [Muricauda sp. SCSIO 65647]